MTTANPSQFSLFGALADLYPRSRRRDPETSRVAARKVAPAYSGQKARVLDAIRAHPMHTACELARLMSHEGEDLTRLRYLVSRRTADLARSGAVRHASAA